MFEFEVATPESVGLSSKCIENFLNRLKKERVPMHSVLMMRHNKLFFEAYFAPYHKDYLHRMFSIAKSFTAIGIGLLVDEEKINLDDQIIKYFPDMLPSEPIHPWLEQLTIRHMLMMRTCYTGSTYVINKTENWTKSFFNVKPTLPPDTAFHYDTSSAQVLCALVERLSGMPLLDYLKEKLSILDFSKESYMIKEPGGFSMGGSGLMITPRDLMKFGYFLSNKGNVAGKQLINPAYIELVTSKFSDTCFCMSAPEETNGYGMQFWCYELGGYMCYGMGGQFVVVIPDSDIILVTTADTQNLPGGNEIIHKAFVEEIVENLTEKLANDQEAQNSLNSLILNLKIDPIEKGVTPDDAVINKIKGNTYKMESNTYGFDDFKFEINETEGKASYTLNGKDFSHPFGFGQNIESIFPKYDMQATSSAKWGTPNTLYIKMHILGEWLGSVHMQFIFIGNDIWIEMKKVEESIFLEYNTTLYGHLKA